VPHKWQLVSRSIPEVIDLRIIYGSYIFAILFGSTFSLCGQSEGTTLYYLKDESHARWCGFKSQSEWRQQVEAHQAFVVGGIDFTQSHATKVHVTTADETGDWSVSDEYSLGDREEIRALKRTIDVVPEDLRQELTYAIQNGKATRRGSTLRVLETEKLVSDRRPVGWLKPPHIITAAHHFPFWQLLTKRQEIWSRGQACVNAVTTVDHPRQNRGK
jgi:hypothetical protein